MKATIFTFALAVIFTLSYGQQQERIWTFGEFNSLDFSTSSPVPAGIPVTGNPGWYFYWSGAVCNSVGQLKFWVKLQSQQTPGASSIPNVFDRFGDPMPNGNLNSQLTGNGVPIFVPFPDDTTRYYIFYVKDGGLLYSVVDLSLNAGRGDIIVNQKNLLLGNWASIADMKITPVGGCRSIWIIAKIKGTDSYLSYEITRNGISPQPVASNGALLPSSWYSIPGAGFGSTQTTSGTMKASPDGKRIAVASNASTVNESRKGGLELYELEPCSGRLMNPVLLDTGSYYGVCFSPDNSKLYATKIYDRQLFQFDISLGSAAAITASRTLILTNPYSANKNKYQLGDLKRGPNGKIYIGNNNCDNASSSFLHVLNLPNLAGALCQPVLNAVSLGIPAGCTGYNLPADIVSFPHADTIIGTTTTVNACFSDSVLLVPTPNGQCYQWMDFISTAKRVIKKQGIYICTYTASDCRYHIDTFKVLFPLKPVSNITGFSCPNSPNGKMVFINRDTTAFTYTWRVAAGTVLKAQTTTSGDSIGGLDTGSYSITFSTADGCRISDTFYIQSMPIPVPGFYLPELICAGTPIDISNLSSAPVITWYIGMDSVKTKNLVQTFPDPGIQSVMQVVMNPEGCRDTLVKLISVRDFELRAEADNYLVHKNEIVHIETLASESYRVTRWTPRYLFADSTAYRQTAVIDTSLRIVIWALSDAGCEDTTSISVDVRPWVFLPTAFSPNGDGRNDHFKPISSGAPIFTVYFFIYSRWGQMVYGAEGRGLKDGWDGKYKGVPCETGTYYYMIQIETPQGGIIKQKGDVTLVR